MKKFILAFSILVATPVLADVPSVVSKEGAALNTIFTSWLEYCRATGFGEDRVGYNCPASAKDLGKCLKTGEMKADMALYQCVAAKIPNENREAWDKSPLNPTAPLTKEAAKQ